ncbi:MAG: LLM class F420-dependent oxidoreductase [Deltaproteobacteria bacterium]|nr:LLM class F420-dependent oxidoreductase [Deltaproteobacteria bacterium]MBV8452822.1 LLM class F420-dependent oxidoreductase [Deltaproteobacteria bacterium]
MKLGLAIGYSGAQLRLPVQRIVRAEELGYDSVWTAESYGSDAMSPLAYLAAVTKRIRLGTGVIQLAARTAANAAMCAGTIDALAGGNRVVVGVGVSGPQIVEGWYGEPWGKPYYRLRDYVTIMRKIFRREGPVAHSGREIHLPYNGPGSSGLGKPLHSILHMNPDIPIFLGTENETTVKLCAELCDGWLPLGFVPGSMPHYRPWLEHGFARAGGKKSLDRFEIFAMLPVVIDRDVRAAFARMKPDIALYAGGMGARTKNFHNDLMVRQGFPEAAARIQELYLAGRKEEAAAAVPDELIDLRALIGPPERIRERYRAWQNSGATGLLIRTNQEEAVELMAHVADLARP